MAIETVTREIDGVTYSVTQLGAMRAVKLLNRIGRVLGPTLARLGGALPPGKFSEIDLEAIDVGKVGDAVAALFSNLDDATLEALLRELLSGVSFTAPDGKCGALFPNSSTAAFDAHFAGRLGAVGRVALFSFEANFGGFSNALAELLARAPAGARAPFASVSPST